MSEPKDYRTAAIGAITAFAFSVTGALFSSVSTQLGNVAEQLHRNSVSMARLEVLSLNNQSEITTLRGRIDAKSN